MSPAFFIEILFDFRHQSEGRANKEAGNQNTEALILGFAARFCV
jgi:hypothetical protein